MKKYKALKSCTICGGKGHYTNPFDQQFKCHCHIHTKKYKQDNFKNNGWISIHTALPKIIHDKDNSCNMVLLWHVKKHTPDCGSQYQLSNTEWVHRHLEHNKKDPWFNYWRYLPTPPK
jgi:hypothetical protein